MPPIPASRILNSAIGKFKSRPEELHLNKQTTISSTNHLSKSRFLLGLPLLFSRKLKVFNPTANAHVYTTVSKSDWRKVKLAGRDPASLAGMSNESLAKRRRLALDIIKKTGQANGLMTVLEKASTHQLCLIARQLGKFGSDQTFRDEVFSALREAQSQYQATTLDSDTVEMLHDMQAETWQGKVRLEPQQAEIADLQLVSVHVGQPNAAVSSQPKKEIRIDQLMQFRQFAGELISEDERDRDQPVDSSERATRLADLCARHHDVLKEVRGLNSDRIENLMEANGLSQRFGKELRSWLRDGFHEVSESEFKRAGAATYRTLAASVDAEVDRFDLSPFGRELMLSVARHGSGALSIFLAKVFNEYFQDGAQSQGAVQSRADRKAMIASLLINSSTVSESSDKMVALLKGSGPYMLKILQLFGDKVDDSNDDGRRLKAALGQLKDELLPIAPDIKKAMLADIVRQSDGQITSLRDVRSIGAASIGETLFAKIEVPGQANTDGAGDGSRMAVIKLLRPGVELRAAREREMMQRLANTVNGMQETFSDIADQIDRELDLSREATNVEKAKVYSTDGLIHLKPVQTVSGVTAARTHMFMERAPGSTVQQHLTHLSNERLPLEARLQRGVSLANRLNELAGLWLKEGLFGSGFYHGDLHGGNIMYRPADPANLEVPEVLTLIDFGNASTLTELERGAMLKLMIAADRKYPEVFVTTLQSMLGPDSAGRLAEDPDLRQRLVDGVSELFAKPNLSGSQRLHQALELANQNNIATPGTIVNFARSQQMLEETMTAINARNESNWRAWESLPQASKAGANPERPQPISVAATFRDTVLSKTWKIAWLVGPSVLRLRTENPAFPEQAVPERAEPAQPTGRAVQAPQAVLAQDAPLLQPEPVGGLSNQKRDEGMLESDQEKLESLPRSSSTVSIEGNMYKRALERFMYNPQRASRVDSFISESD